MTEPTARPKLTLDDLMHLKNLLHVANTTAEVRGYFTSDEVHAFATLEIRFAELYALTETREFIRKSFQ